MSKIHKRFSQLLKKKLPINPFIVLLFLSFFGIQGAAAQTMDPPVFFITPLDVSFECFDTNDFSEADLMTTCEGGFANVDIVFTNDNGTADECTSGPILVIYSGNTNCEDPFELEREVVITNPGLLLDIGEELVTVECTEDINVTADDIAINLPCGAIVNDIAFTAPDFSDPVTTCNNRRHIFTWLVETTCGTFEAEKEFVISNQEVRIIGAEDITISCLDHPLSDEVLLQGLSLEHACSNYPESGPIELDRPNEDLPSDFTEAVSFTYDFVVQDACTGSDQNARISVTVLPELPTIVFDDEVTIINSLELLEDDEFLLLGVNFVAPCCDVFESQVFAPVIDDSAEGESGGIPASVEYSFIDECGNEVFAQRNFLFLPAATVPTLSEWSVIILGLVFLIFGIVALRQRLPKIIRNQV